MEASVAGIRVPATLAPAVQMAGMLQQSALQLSGGALLRAESPLLSLHPSSQVRQLACRGLLTYAAAQGLQF